MIDHVHVFDQELAFECEFKQSLDRSSRAHVTDARRMLGWESERASERLHV